MRKLIAIGVTLVLATGCGDSSSESPATTSTIVTTSTTAATTSVSESDQVSAIGVLFAALVLRDGDIEQAVADGLVTVQEVDNATTAIKEGTLSEWATLASK